MTVLCEVVKYVNLHRGCFTLTLLCGVYVHSFSVRYGNLSANALLEVQCLSIRQTFDAPAGQCDVETVTSEC